MKSGARIRILLREIAKDTPVLARRVLWPSPLLLGIVPLHEEHATTPCSHSQPKKTLTAASATAETVVFELQVTAGGKSSMTYGLSASLRCCSARAAARAPLGRKGFDLGFQIARQIIVLGHV